MHIKLTHQENLILNIVQQHLEKKREFNMKKLLSLIQIRFRLSNINVNKNGIQNILRSLIKKNFVVEGSKLVKTNILNNQKRRIIFKYITNHPGTYFLEIVKDLNLNFNVVIWHLNILEKFTLVKRKQIENRYIYFNNQIDFKQVKQIHFLERNKTIKIINFLKQNNNGITKTKLAEYLNMHYNTIKKYIDKMEQYDLLNKKYESNKLLYLLNLENYKQAKSEFNLE